LKDIPKDTETIYIYKLIDNTSGSIHIYGKGCSGWYVIADYRYMPEVDGELLRNNKTWREWTINQKEVK